MSIALRDRTAELEELMAQRILVLDGAMGTMIQTFLPWIPNLVRIRSQLIILRTCLFT